MAAESEKTRRVCLLADIEGYGEQQPVAQSALTVRLKAVIGAALKSPGVDSAEAWRLDRVSRQLALLPVAADAAAVVPLLVRSLLAGLGEGRTVAGPRLRVRAVITSGAVTQVKGGYAGRAVATAARLADSHAGRAEFEGDPAAQLALIMSDEVYQDVLARGKEFPLDGFHQVSIEAPEPGWQGTAWVRACGPGSFKPPPRRLGKKIADNIFPVLGAGADDVVSVFEGTTGTAGEHGGDELATASDHLMAGHADATEHAGADHASYAVSDLSAAETAYVVDEAHTYTYDNNGYIQEYGTHTVYDGTAYDAHGYDSSGDHSGGVA